MIKTLDRRQLFTHEKHLSQLVEFARTFSAQLAIVEANVSKLLDLYDLVKQIKNGTQQGTSKIIEIKFPKKPVVKSIKTKSK